MQKYKMFVNFNEFLNEKLGTNQDVILLSNVIINAYEKNKDKNSIVINNIDLNGIKIKKIIIEVGKINSFDFAGMSFNSKLSIYDEKNGHTLFFKINKNYNPTHSLFQHESTHAYQFIKSKGRDLSKYHSDILNPFLRMKSSESNIKKFLEIMYFIQFKEIEAYYQYDLRLISRNESSDNGWIKEIIEIMDKFDINNFFNTISKKDLNALAYFYYNNIAEKKNLSGFIKRFLGIKNKIKELDNQIIQNFINKIQREVVIKRKLLLKYYGRLKLIEQEKLK